MSVLYTFLLCAAFTVAELLIGGTRLLFSVPAYLLLALAALLSVSDLRRVKTPPGGFCLLSSALFFGYILCRGLVSPVAYIARADEFMVLGALVVYLLTACYLTDPRRRLWTLACLLALGFVNLAVGIQQFVTGSNSMLFGFTRSDRYTGRASGLYICPDHLAFLLEVVGCLALAVAFWGRARLWVRLAFGYGAVCLFAGLILTGSRGGFLSLGVGLAAMTLLGLMRLARTAPRLIPRALLAVLLAAGLLGWGLREAISRNALLKSRAQIAIMKFDVRPMLWKAGLAQFRLSPAFGTGASTYLYYGRRLRNPLVQDDPIRTHNDYLELLGEYGAVGAAGLLLFLAAHGVAGWRAYRSFSLRAVEEGSLLGGATGSNAAAWNIGALSAVAVVAAHSVVDFNLHIPVNALLTALVFGVLANPGRGFAAESAPSPRVRPIDWWPRLALPALGLSIFVAGAPLLPGEYYCEKARAALRDHHYLAASGYALKGLAHEDRNPQLYAYLGEARLSLAGDGPETPLAHSFREGASEAFGRGLELAPCDTALLLRQAQLLTIFGDLPAAHRVLAQALLWDPNSALAQTYYGFYLERAGQPENAREAYAFAMRLAPNSAAANGMIRLAQPTPHGQ